MKRVIGLCLLLVCAPASAWEADSTHAGLTEQAAVASGLHAALSDAWGRALGWYEPVAVAPADAAALYQKLAKLPPSGGYVPDARGRQTALAWLVAGAVLEDMPSSRAKNHFFDPIHKRGLSGKEAKGLRAFFEKKLVGGLAGLGAGGSGLAAPDWVASPNNDLGMNRFLLELEQSAAAPTAAERDRHFAFALLCAGAMTHILEDAGSPSRARDDFAEHLQELGGGSSDRGSRFERLAALAYGRLGVPAPAGDPVVKSRWRDYFTAADGSGLADRTTDHFFSVGTLPGEVPIGTGDLAGAVQKTLTFPNPRPNSLNVEKAAAAEGTPLDDADGVCLAVYRRTGDHIEWLMPDDCANEQIAAILPDVGRYAAGFLAWLFRGRLSLDEGRATAKLALGKGNLRFFSEDKAGRRVPLGPTLAVTSAASGASIVDVPVPPPGTVRVVALFRGVDAAGEELVAAGELQIR